MFEVVKADICRYTRTESFTFAQAIKPIVRSFGLQALLVYRFGCWVQTLAALPRYLLFPIYWLLHALVMLAYDIDLQLSAVIGPGLLIWHFGGIRLRNCTLGTHCTVHQQVCLEPAAGATEGPRIGDRVWFGPHAQVQGNFHIEPGSTVGAGARVAQDVKTGTVVLGAPARVVQRDFDNSVIL
jgi:serine O-acetyltransferase